MRHILSFRYRDSERCLRSPDFAVHPESYDAAKALLDLTGHTLADVKGGRLADLPDRVKAYGEDKAAGEIGVGAFPRCAISSRSS